MDADLDLHSIRIVRAIAETGAITGAAVRAASGDDWGLTRAG